MNAPPPAMLDIHAAVDGDRVAGHVWADLLDADAFAVLGPAWRSLAGRAVVPNAFVEPAVVRAIARSSPDPLRIVLAWHSGGPAGSPPRLIGAWPFLLRRPRATWPFGALVSPLGALAYLGTPAIDAEMAREAVAALLAKIRQSPGLPRLIHAGDLSDGGPFMANLMVVLAEERMGWATVERRTRAKLQSDLDPKLYWANSMSVPRLQGMARKRRQLAKSGKLEFVVTVDPAGLSAALDDFFALEASGWKGTRRSALASSPATAEITRAMVAGLAEEGLVRTHALRLDGRPVAMWIILYSGNAAFTWRTGYDEAYGRFSPGVLLLEDTTTALLSDPAVAMTDSCNHRDSGFQAERWAGRHDVVDLLIGVRAGSGFLVGCLAGRERIYRAARSAARRMARAAMTLKEQVVGRVAGWMNRGA